jgi:hypothetical protein
LRKRSSSLLTWQDPAHVDAAEAIRAYEKEPISAILGKRSRGE